jgi:hypothetical protein
MCQKAKTDRGGQKNDSLSVNMAEYLKKVTKAGWDVCLYVILVGMMK